jgi:Rrf2 family protein
VPRNYLGKVLHALAGAGVLTSVRGPHGGFQLAKNAEQLTLAEVVSPFHRVQERTTCLRGDHACDLANPCRSHAHWQVMTSMLTSFFQKTTIATLLRGGDEANAQPSQPPVAQELSGTAATEFTPRRRVS